METLQPEIMLLTATDQQRFNGWAMRVRNSPKIKFNKYYNDMNKVFKAEKQP